MQNMPLGPSLRWFFHKKKFRKYVFQGQTSFSAVQWLQYEQTKYGVQIQHSYHQGEKFVYGMFSIFCTVSWTIVHFWTVVHFCTVVHSVQLYICSFLGCRVDGYAVNNGVETVWEYNGCSVHGCPKCKKNRTDEQLEKQQKWIERKAHLETNGCHVIEMTDCRWNKQLRYLRRNPPKTEYGRILCFDNQECFTFCFSRKMDSCTFVQIA